MGNMIIADSTLMSIASVTGSNLASGSAFSNTLDIQPSNKWRTADVSASIYVVFAFTSAVAVDTVSLVKTNAAASATFQVRAANSLASTTSNPDYDSGLLDQWPEADLSDWEETSALLHIASTQTYKYFRIDIVDSNNPDLYYEVGRIFLAKAWQPTKNMSWNNALRWQDNSLRRKAISGRTYIVPRDKYRVIDFSLDFLDEDEMYNNAFELDRIHGSSKDVFISFDPDSANHKHKQMLQGLITELSPVVNANFGIYRKKYRIEELL